MPSTIPRTRSSPTRALTLGALRQARNNLIQTSTPREAPFTVPITVTGTPYVNPSALHGSTDVTREVQAAVDSTPAANRLTSPVVTVEAPEGIPTLQQAITPLATVASKYGNMRQIYNHFANHGIKYKGEWCHFRCDESWGEPTYINVVPFSRYWTNRTYRYNTSDRVNCSDILISDLDTCHGKWGNFTSSSGVYDNVTCDVRSTTYGFNVGYIRYSNIYSVIPWKDPAFIDMLEGVYPSLEDAFSKVVAKGLEGVTACGFAAKYSLKRIGLRMILLLKEKETIGELILNKDSKPSDIELYPAYDYLQRSLKKDTGLDLNIAQLEVA